MVFPLISPSHRESMLRHNWWGHDGRWYLFVAQECGFEKANAMNLSINQAVGKMEIQNLAAVSGLDREGMREAILDVLRWNLDLCTGDVFDIAGFEQAGNSLVLTISACPACAGTQKAGYRDLYECACFKRAEGWLEGLGVPGSATIRKSLVRGDESCEIVMTLEHGVEATAGPSE